MEFLIISSTKMKVKLSDEEVKRYSLSDMESERVDSGMRKGLWQLLDIAKERHGFSFSKEKLLVQFYKTEDGGELFVTKLLQQSAKTDKVLEGATNIALLKENRSIFRFSDADSVLHALYGSGLDAASVRELYYSDDGCYYLVLNTERYGFLGLGFLSEFGEEELECIYPLIVEHSRLLGGSDDILNS